MAECVTCRREITLADRRVLVALTVRWGDSRSSWTPLPSSFCSFGCCETWLGVLASEHDGVFRHVPVALTVEAT